MRDVLFFGSLGKAVYEKDGEWFMVREENAEPESVRAGDVGLFLDSGAEVEKKSLSDADFARLQEDLKTARENADALEMTLDCFNEEFSGETRVACADAAEELLAKPAVEKFVLNRMLSKPLPEGPYAETARDTLSRFESLHLKRAVEKVLACQGAVVKVRETWLQTANEYFDERALFLRTESAFVEEGLFAYAVEAVASKENNRIGMIPIEFSNKAGIKAIPGTNRLVAKLAMAWGELLPKETLAEMEPDEEEPREIQEKKREKVYSAVDTDKIQRDIRDIVQDFLVEKKEQAESLLDKLRIYQNNSPKYWCQSLCNIAGQISARADLCKTAIKLYEEAVRVWGDDPVPLNGLAELYRDMGRYDDAEKMYEKARGIAPDNPVCMNGLAGLYRDMGRYGDAEKVYFEACEIAPHDLVSQCGLAELYRDMRRYQDAEKAYLEALKIGPNPVSLCGLAELYKAQEKYEDAVELYVEAKDNLKPDVYTFCGLGFLYIRMKKGNWFECNGLFLEALKLQPTNPVALLGRYVVLQLLGKEREEFRREQPEARSQLQAKLAYLKDSQDEKAREHYAFVDSIETQDVSQPGVQEKIFSLQDYLMRRRAA